MEAQLNYSSQRLGIICLINVSGISLFSSWASAYPIDPSHHSKLLIILRVVGIKSGGLDSFYFPPLCLDELCCMQRCEIKLGYNKTGLNPEFVNNNLLFNVRLWVLKKEDSGIHPHNMTGMKLYVRNKPSDQPHNEFNEAKQTDNKTYAHHRQTEQKHSLPTTVTIRSVRNDAESHVEESQQADKLSDAFS